MPRRRWLNRTVAALSATSLFSDISHEMGTAVLPVFVASLSGGAAALGLIEGVATFVMSLGKLWGGGVGDRLRQRKWLTGGGYLLTTLGIGSYALAGSWLHVLIGRGAAWFGRGFRGPLRDALMADGVESSDYGKAFGLERAADAAGAVIGPLLAVLLLYLLFPLRHILAFAIIPGLIASVLVWLLVREEPREPQESHPKFFTRLHKMPGGFKRFLFAIAVFALGDYSNTLLILWALGGAVDFTANLADPRVLTPILFYAGYNVVDAAVSYVSGALSDVWGRRWLLVGGYTCGVVVAFLIAYGGSPTFPLMVAVFALAGVTAGNQEAVEKAFAADFLREHERALGFGTLALVNGLGKLVASAAVGALWAVYGVTVAFTVAGTVSLLGVILLAVLTRPSAITPEATTSPA
ncbi:MAG: MFS transporter [Armatimonadia bacterium]